MKRFLLGTAAACFALAASAQVNPPTSCDFNTAPDVLPEGWSTNTSDFYSSGLNGSNAAKISNQNDYYQVDLSDEPGLVTYYLRYYGAGNFGEFILQESEDGTIWSDIHVYSNGDLSDAWVQFTDTADRDSRFIRWIYTNDESGTNVGLDDASIAVAPPPTTPEINVTESGAGIPSGDMIAFDAPVGDSLDVTFMVHNIGTQDTLYVTNAALSGASMSEFTILSTPDTVPNMDSVALTIRFKPTMMGTREAVLTIDNTDSNESAYEINLYGIGGDYATEPTAQASGITFSNVASWDMDAAISGSATQPDGYIVLRRNGAAVADMPVDGVWYDKGDVIGDSKVEYIGDASSMNLDDIVANREVHVAVFSYNGPGEYVNYLTTGPLTDSQTASDNMMGTYYAGISSTSGTFMGDLADRLANPHSLVYYSEYEQLLIPNVYARDTVDGQRVVTCQYSGEEKIYAGPFSWTSLNFAREHTFARSWMPPDGTMSTDEKPGADLHNLHPTNQNDVNAVRSNHPFGTSDNVNSTYLDATLWSDINNQKWYEVRDQNKGDVARSLMYVLMRYDYDATWGTYDWTDFPFDLYQQDQALLKAWHAQDPPSDFEVARNDYIQTEQGNRNPFIDHPEWVDAIDFETMQPVGVEEHQTVRDLTVFPNPNDGFFRISMNATNGEALTLSMVDITGKQVWNSRMNATAGYNYLDVADLGLESGIYLLEINGSNGTLETKKVVVK